jgi:hypothetical protein
LQNEKGRLVTERILRIRLLMDVGGAGSEDR